MKVESAVLLTATSDQPLDLNSLIELVADQSAGAIASFLGVVRDHDGGKAVDHLVYETHPDVNRIMAEVAEQVAERHPEVRMAVVHRVGKLEIGDAAVAAAAASAHRTEAFAAVAELVENLKHQVPIWKHQVFADGSTEWVGSPAPS